MTHTEHCSIVRLVIMLLIACSALLFSIPNSAQTTLTPATGLTAEILENRIRDTEVASDLDETVKTVLLELYRKTGSFIVRRQNAQTVMLEFEHAKEFRGQYT
jgi:hypothetical protein